MQVEIATDVTSYLQVELLLRLAPLGFLLAEFHRELLHSFLKRETIELNTRLTVGSTCAL